MVMLEAANLFGGLRSMKQLRREGFYCDSFAIHPISVSISERKQNSSYMRYNTGVRHRLCASYTSAIILKISHGYAVEPDGIDPFVNLAHDVAENIIIQAYLPGRWIVDLLPFRE